MHPDKIDWKWMSGNKAMVPMIEAHPDKIDWDALSINKNAMHLLETHSDRICWRNLARNQSAVHLLMKYPERIHWDQLLHNKRAETLLEMPHIRRAYIDAHFKQYRTIEWLTASAEQVKKNATIDITYDYAAMRAERGELMASIANHPRFVAQWLADGHQLEDF